MSNDDLYEDSFDDPLENYEPKTYSDPIEKSIAEDPVTNIRHQPFVAVSPDISATDAVNKLAAEHVSCLLVEEDERLVGVFTDREVLHKIALADNAADIKLRDVMTADPVYVYEDDPIAAALCVMAASGYRHVPVVNGEEKITGIISPQRVTNYLTSKFQK
jgi:CBS domain-containing protein